MEEIKYDKQSILKILSLVNKAYYNELDSDEEDNREMRTFICTKCIENVAIYRECCDTYLCSACSKATHCSYEYSEDGDIRLHYYSPYYCDDCTIPCVDCGDRVCPGCMRYCKVCEGHMCKYTRGNSECECLCRSREVKKVLYTLKIPAVLIGEIEAYI